MKTHRSISTDAFRAVQSNADAFRFAYAKEIFTELAKDPDFKTPGREPAGANEMQMAYEIAATMTEHLFRGELKALPASMERAMRRCGWRPSVRLLRKKLWGSHNG